MQKSNGEFLSVQKLAIYPITQEHPRKIHPEILREIFSSVSSDLKLFQKFRKKNFKKFMKKNHAKNSREIHWAVP